MMTKCLGCGINLQTKNPHEVGYTPKEDALVCERCFRLKNYNEYKEVELININNKIIERVNKDNYLTIFLIDLLNINEETINTYHSITSPKILIISKKDIIPFSIKEDIISTFLKKTYSINENIYYLSSKKKYNINSIMELANNTKEKKAYIVGYTNSGKSTLINTITQKLGKDSLITTSSIPNTTLDFLEIKIGEITIIDTPGFILNKTLYNSKEYELIRRINPKSYIKPLTIQTKDNTGLLIEDKIYLSPHNNNSLTFYISNNIKIEKVFKESLIEEGHHLLKVPANSDVVIKGLGFINIKKECNLQINTSYIDLIEIRESLFNKEK